MKRKATVLALVLAFVLSFGSFSVFAGVGAPTDDTRAAIEKAGVQSVKTIKNEVNAEAFATDLVNQVNKGKYKLVSTAKLKKWVDKKSAVVVDTMPAGWFAQRHIPGAVQATAGGEDGSKGPAFLMTKAEKKKLDDKFVDIRKRDRVEQKIKNEKYWEEHQEEKKQLLDEHSKLDHEIFELENSKLKMPELTELKKLEEEAIRLQVLKDNPVYSNKERAAYMEQLNKTRKQIVTKKRELASRLNPIEDKIEKYKKRMYNIEKELNMNR